MPRTAAPLLLLTALLAASLAPAAEAQVASLAGPDDSPVSLSTAWSHDDAAPGQTVHLAVVFDLDAGWHVNPPQHAIPDALNYLIPTTIKPPEQIDGLTFDAPRFPAPHTIEVNYTGQPIDMPVYEGRTVIVLPVTVADDAAPGERSFDVEVGYQSCDDSTCLRPQTQTLTVTLPVDPAGGQAINEDMFADLEPAAPAKTPAEPDTATSEDLPGAGVLPWASLLSVLGLAFVGGMVLNVMPCVLPVIPIKILGLVQAAPQPGRRVALGAVMALGVLGFWVALGLVIALVASEQRAISALFGYWWFNMGLGLFIVLLAVGMCGLFSMRLPRWVYAINPRHDSYTGAFGFGVMTGVLATPCTGPFLGAAAGTVLGSGPLLALAVFFAIGLGMAIPYFVLTAWPGLVERLPRTGPASELVKQVLGLLMVAAGAFFIGAGVNALISDGTGGVYQWYWWLAAAVIAAAGLWLAFKTFAITPSPRRRAAFAALGVVMAGSSLAFAYDATRPSDIQWVYYTPERLADTLDRGHVVALDFTADWCINCKVIERTVLETDPVIAAMAERDVTAMKVDLTSNTAPGWQLLNDHGRAAIPLLVVLNPQGEAVFKEEVYTPTQVVNAIEKARE